MQFQADISQIHHILNQKICYLRIILVTGALNSGPFISAQDIRQSIIEHVCLGGVLLDGVSVREVSLHRRCEYTLSVNVSHMFSKKSHVSERFPLERLGFTQGTHHHHQQCFKKYRCLSQTPKHTECKPSGLRIKPVFPQKTTSCLSVHS